MTLTAICGQHRNRSFKMRDWPTGVEWTIKEGEFRLNKHGEISVPNVKVIHVTSTEWEFC